MVSKALLRGLWQIGASTSRSLHVSPVKTLPSVRRGTRTGMSLSEKTSTGDTVNYGTTGERVAELSGEAFRNKLAGHFPTMETLKTPMGPDGQTYAELPVVLIRCTKNNTKLGFKTPDGQEICYTSSSMDSAAHTFDLIKRIDSKTSQLVQRFEVHEVRLLEFVAEKPRRFVLVIHQAHGWFHLFAKLDVGQDPAALENALTASSSPPSANSRDDLTPASSILQRQGELSYMSWIKWAQTRKIRHQRYPRANHSTSINSRIFLFSGDIVSLKVNMITNAANPDLLKGSGIDDHIHKAAGWDPANSDYKLRLYCKKLGGCPVGSAKVTPSFDIGSLHSGAGWIAHAVGPNYRLPFADTGKEMYETEKGRAEAQRLLTSAYTAALQCALDVGAKSIALPCISTGKYGFPSPDAADIAGAAVRHFLDNRANNRLEGFKNAKKKTMVAGQATGVAAALRALRRGVRSVRVLVKGLGPGRMASVKGLVLGGINVVSITDITPLPEVGPRPQKMRRI